MEGNLITSTENIGFEGWHLAAVYARGVLSAEGAEAVSTFIFYIPSRHKTFVARY